MKLGIFLRVSLVKLQTEMPLTLRQQHRKSNTSICMPITLQVPSPACVCQATLCTDAQLGQHHAQVMSGRLTFRVSFWFEQQVPLGLLYSCLMGFVCVESFIVPEATTSYVDWYHKPKRCFPCPSVSYKVLLEHDFQCFLPVQRHTSCD